MSKTKQIGLAVHFLVEVPFDQEFEGGVKGAFINISSLIQDKQVVLEDTYGNKVNAKLLEYETMDAWDAI